MHDIYLYEGTEILKNKFNVRNLDELKQLESAYTSTALADLVENPINGEFDVNHLQKIHEKIFKDIYDWAGEFRKINIEKPETALSGLSVQYSDVFDIRKDLIHILTSMHKEKWKVSIDENVNLFCYYLTEIWKVHPFREGNTRTTMFFFYEYMDSLGINLDTTLLSENAEYVRTSLVAASFELKDVCERNYSYLKKIVNEAMRKQ